MSRWARLGTRKRGWTSRASDAGVCISAFIVARRNKMILLGRPRNIEAWPREGRFPRSRIARVVRDEAWILPATHLLIDESPNHAAKRIVLEWLGVRNLPKFVMVQSFVRPSKMKGRNHWDLCFVYELQLSPLPRLKPCWSEIGFFSPSEIKRNMLGRSHFDVLREARYV